MTVSAHPSREKINAAQASPHTCPPWCTDTHVGDGALDPGCNYHTALVGELDAADPEPLPDGTDAVQRVTVELSRLDRDGRRGIPGIHVGLLHPENRVDWASALELAVLLVEAVAQATSSTSPLVLAELLLQAGAEEAARRRVAAEREAAGHVVAIPAQRAATTPTSVAGGA